MTLKDRNVIVTGGSRGLGRAIVEAFLHAGASVAFCARSAHEVEQTVVELRQGLRPGQKLLGIRCDISSAADLDAFFTAADQFGDLHVLVNNAGTYGSIDPIDEISICDWRHAFDVNLFGTVQALQRAIPRMKQQQYGKLIQISGGGVSPIRSCSAYSVSKMALARLTESIAEELRPWQIDCNAVAPGPLNTRFLLEVLKAGPERVGAEFYEKNVSWSNGAAVSPQIAANVCVYLASETCDGITGKLIAAQWDPWKDLHRFKADLAGDVYTFRRIEPRDRGLAWGDR